MLSPEKVKGTQFEIFLEQILKRKGFSNVLRDVEYHKSRYCFRQIDLSYSFIDSGIIRKVVVEAKYSSNGPISYRFRSPRNLEHGKVIINGPLEQIIESRNFSRADIGVLATNRRFDDNIREAAGRYGIRLIEGDNLCSMIGYDQDQLDRYIRSISIKQHNLNKSIIYQ